MTVGKDAELVSVIWARFNVDRITGSLRLRVSSLVSRLSEKPINVGSVMSRVNTDTGIALTLDIALTPLK